MDQSLLEKYDVQAPRYTSYPPVPLWDDRPVGEKEWAEHLSAAFGRPGKEGISLYIHLPYCESLCTYCACNTRITVNHKVEGPYIENLLREWRMYRAQSAEVPVLRELHLGGGTPTFFSPENLRLLLESIFADLSIAPDAALSFEGHPNNTTEEHLRTLYDLGFRRVSYGIQTFEPKVQEVINRVQTYETVVEITRLSREIGYTSINYDLVFGLPFQDMAGIEDTVAKVVGLKPERIAFYSYAHVPWIKPGQRMFTEADLPSGPEKRALYEKGRAMFEAAGYLEVGMDHFALPGDQLFDSFREGSLHRNFMGYTPFRTELLIGLGASAISDAQTAYWQNIKAVEPFLEALEQGKVPIFRGHLLSEEDKIAREQILDVICRYETTLPEGERSEGIVERLQGVAEDELVAITEGMVSVTEVGKPFVRNVCVAFDHRLAAKKPGKQAFSKAV